ncbi:hypothetical protein TW84_18845 [Vibrio neptunius]|uniref:acetyl/propionyl/methylcrotonyl-CoA carboxylase subunit alpha n=1 Tax=Vibrio neptunius TaxID=170651 RepID=UPI0005FA79AA|nr:biotin carboxylase N-terminal domain-containing protein [Vibrio neptunius]KJY86874.1 hypothetical protein TW84_18845 [Vibrio neptunius]
MLKRILIANRGEIAQRVARTCLDLGIEYVGIHSDEDGDSEYLLDATQCVHLEGSSALETYLNIDKVVQAALDSDCDAVHPGYGFLSENADFALALESKGIKLIGPTSEMIGLMGNKSTAKEVMARAGLPVLPGSVRGTSDKAQLISDAETIGYPLILKPVLGGGGKGMAIVYDRHTLEPAIEEACRVAKAAFGDERLLIERYIESPRHIEVQVACDHFGNVIHLFDRECSIQRRHQKIIEEAPVSYLSEEVRQEYLSAAVEAMENIRYTSIGTIEFIFDGKQFYFMEMNTRLQVEHTVTEEITGIDLVELQIRIAANQPLSYHQAQIRTDGHSIQARLYAENPYKEFQPEPGTVKYVRWPSKVRVERAFSQSGNISGYYDPMFGKVISHAATRDKARKELITALEETSIIGVTTNIVFLKHLLEASSFVSNDVSTDLVDQHVIPVFLKQGCKRDRLDAALAIAANLYLSESLKDIRNTPWVKSAGSTLSRGLGEQHIGRVELETDDGQFEVLIQSIDLRSTRVAVEGQVFNVSLSGTSAQEVKTGNIGALKWHAIESQSRYFVEVGGESYSIQRKKHEFGAQKNQSDITKSEISGVIVSVLVEEGQHVEAGKPLIIVEAMKMETTIFAQKQGVVSNMHCSVGDIVNKGDTILKIADGLKESM